MNDLETLEQFEESYYREHPEEIDTYKQNRVGNGS